MSTMQATTASARATIEAFHARLAAAEKQQHQAWEQQDQQQFQDMYSPCNSSSTFHDLQCGHRIQTEYTASCGGLCARPVQGYPFVCPTCLIDVVRAEVALEGLTLKLNHNEAVEGSGSSQESEVRRVAEQYIAAMLRRGYRACKAVAKFDEPRLQFFDEFMRQDGFGGVEEECNKEEPVTPRKRPGTATARKAKQNGSDQTPRTLDFRDSATGGAPAERKKMADMNQAVGGAMGGNPSQSVETWVNLPPESAATEAVRKAMEAFSLL